MWMLVDVNNRKFSETTDHFIIFIQETGLYISFVPKFKPHKQAYLLHVYFDTYDAKHFRKNILT